jgi:transketolase
MGKGARNEAGESFEAKISTHGMPLSEAGGSFYKTVENLGGDPENPFTIFSDVAEYYKTVREKKIKQASLRKQQQQQWMEENPELKAKWEQFWSSELPNIDWASIEQKANAATRNASGTVLSVLAKNVENMIVSSADLSNSDKTDGFLKNSKVLKKNDFSGAFLQAGVAELTMATVMNGIAAHGGLRAVCATFFTFSDYMKPAIRMAALMKLPVIYLFTHDSFRVGEDGPTHQPVEQEAQIRLLEKMNNLDGKRSLLVFRPADADETTVGWKMLLEADIPGVLVLSRQNINNLPAKEGSTRFNDAMQSYRGGYVVKQCEGLPDIVLVGNGSEVATLIDGSKIIEADKGLKVRVVSVPSEGLFNEQSLEYRESVIPFGVPVFGLTAGLPDSLKGLVGPLGKVYGLQRFGASAPYKVLDEKFGFTAENVALQVEIYLKEYNNLLGRISQSVPVVINV